MTTHKAKLSWISRSQKTVTTECGKAVKVSAVAMDSDCTCSGCIAEVDNQYAAMEEMAKYAAETPALADSAKGLRDAIEADAPRKYRTIYFL